MSTAVADPLEALDDVRRAIEAALAGCSWPELKKQVTAYLLAPPLPRLALLPLATCAASGGTPRQAAVVASASLLLVLSTRWLDDLADRDRDDTLHQSIGEGRAMTLAAGALSLAWWQLATSPVVPRPLLARFGDATLRLGAGQDQDLRGGEVTVEQAWEILRGKTAAGFAFLCESGGWMAGAPAAECAVLARAGEHLGVMIQLLDDLDGVLSPQGRGDLAIRKQSNLLLVHGLNGPQRETMRRLLADGDTARLRDLLLATGAAPAVLAAALQERDLALQAFGELAPRPGGTAGLGRQRLINFTRGVFSQLPESLLNRLSSG
jgi:geranylgeranyl pyrophosphate synthase